MYLPMVPVPVGAQQDVAPGADDAGGEPVVNLDPIARRVVRRFQSAIAVEDDTRIEYTDSGFIFGVTIMKLLRPTVGNLVKLRFGPALTGLPNTVAFEAVRDDGAIIEGRVILHAAVDDDAIFSWGEVVVDGTTIRGNVEDELKDTPEARLNAIANRARLMLRRLTDPKYEIDEMLIAFKFIVGVAEGTAPVP